MVEYLMEYYNYNGKLENMEYYDFWNVCNGMYQNYWNVQDMECSIPAIIGIYKIVVIVVLMECIKSCYGVV